MTLATNADRAKMVALFNRDYLAPYFFGASSAKRLAGWPFSNAQSGLTFLTKNAAGDVLGWINFYPAPSPRTRVVGPCIRYWVVDRTLAPATALRGARKLILEAAKHYNLTLGYQIGWGILNDTARARNLLEGYARFYTLPDFAPLDLATTTPSGGLMYCEGGPEIYPVLESTS